jgi:hypothetical protein
MTGESLSLEAEEALVNAKRDSLVKKLNAASWSPHMEDLMKKWGEKAAGLRFIHSASCKRWKGIGNRLTLISIFISTVSSAISLVAASIDDEEAKDMVLYGVGIVGLVGTFIQSIKKFYKAEEKAADHGAIAKQFGSYYRYVTLQMGMSREDRVPSSQFTEWALKEYERLQQDSPPVDGKSIALFKSTFSDTDQAVPDVCEDKFTIKVYEEMAPPAPRVLDDSPVPPLEPLAPRGVRRNWSVAAHVDVDNV